MKLGEILFNLDYEINKKDYGNIEIENISYSSKDAGPDTIFVALAGKTIDGHKFIADAHTRGSRVFMVSDREIEEYEDSIYIYVDNTRRALSRISSNYFMEPSKSLKVIGITGTKGKTTTSNYIKQVLERAGKSTGVIGTNGVYYADIEEKTKNTTPESYELHRILRDMLDSGVEYLVMEVSSGGLMMNRVDDIDFDLGVFTNISVDHIGPKEHPNFEHYLESKAKLFKMCKHGIINLDDKHADYIIENANCEFTSYAIENIQADLLARKIDISKDLDHLGVKFNLFDRRKKDGQEEEYLIASPGIFSVYNALTVISVCNYLDIDKELVKSILKTARVAGRVEVLPVLDYAKVILDYAHNKTSLENVLDTLRDYKPNKLYCLVGSVGGRSIPRRYEIGEVISKRVDVSILTSDNPNFEDPMEIIEDIKRGFVDNRSKIYVEPDRTEAIKLAIGLLEEGDILLLAGKGHESYQIIEGEKVPYSDKEVALSQAPKK